VSHIGSIGLAGNLTSYAMTLPAGLANNDVLVLGVAHSSTVTVSSISKTAITTGQVVEGGLVVDYYAVLLQATDSSTTFTVAMSGAASKTAVAGDIFRGNDTTTPATFVTRHAQDTVRQSPSVTPTATSDIWAFCAERTATGTTTSFTAPAGITKTQDQVNTSTAPDNAVCGYATGVVGGDGRPVRLDRQRRCHQRPRSRHHRDHQPRQARPRPARCCSRRPTVRGCRSCPCSSSTASGTWQHRHLLEHPMTQPPQPDPAVPRGAGRGGRGIHGRRDPGRHGAGAGRPRRAGREGAGGRGDNRRPPRAGSRS
jgi:hypothetical protein